MMEKLLAFLDRFPGRRAWLPLMGATSVLGLALFLIFPPAALPPVNFTGGGALVQRGVHVQVPGMLSRAPSPLARFLTLNLGDLVDLSPGPVSFGGHSELLARVGTGWKFRAQGWGHSMLTVGKGRRRHTIYLFVSPLPARQVGREDLEWYRTQYGTGTANCGPALVSMALLWSRSEDVPVQSIRDEIGYPYDDGAVSFDNLADALGRHHVRTTSPQLSGPEDLRRIIDQGHIALVLIQSGLIQRTPGDPSQDLVGRYYDDDEGHYVLVKGYTMDRGFFVVYDPYPVDWESNSLRYGDGASMIGKNRYYPSPQLFGALKTSTVLEVWPG